MTIIYRTAGAWGAGKGSNLTPAEVDGNFWDHEQRLLALEGASAPVSISNIIKIGSQLTIFMSDGSTYGPFTLPGASFRDRGTWEPGETYYEFDVFTDPDTNLRYLVNQDHDAASSFDPAEENSDGLLVFLLPNHPFAKTITHAEATLTIGVEHIGKFIRYTNAGGCTITFESGLPIDAEITHFADPGPLSFDAITGVSLRAATGFDLATDRSDAVVVTKVIDIDEIIAFGLLAGTSA